MPSADRDRQARKRGDSRLIEAEGSKGESRIPKRGPSLTPLRHMPPSQTKHCDGIVAPPEVRDLDCLQCHEEAQTQHFSSA